MTQYIKKVKFSGILKDFEYARGKPIRAFIKDVVSEDGLIRKSFYWLEKSKAKFDSLKRDDKVSFEVKYNMNIGE